MAARPTPPRARQGRLPPLKWEVWGSVTVGVRVLILPGRPSRVDALTTGATSADASAGATRRVVPGLAAWAPPRIKLPGFTPLKGEASGVLRRWPPPHAFSACVTRQSHRAVVWSTPPPFATQCAVRLAVLLPRRSRMPAHTGGRPCARRLRGPAHQRCVRPQQAAAVTIAKARRRCPSRTMATASGATSIGPRRRSRSLNSQVLPPRPGSHHTATPAPLATAPTRPASASAARTPPPQPPPTAPRPGRAYAVSSPTPTNAHPPPSSPPPLPPSFPPHRCRPSPSPSPPHRLPPPPPPPPTTLPPPPPRLRRPRRPHHPHHPRPSRAPHHLHKIVARHRARHRRRRHLRPRPPPTRRRPKARRPHQLHKRRRPAAVAQAVIAGARRRQRRSHARRAASRLRPRALRPPRASRGDAP